MRARDRCRVVFQEEGFAQKMGEKRKKKTVARYLECSDRGRCYAPAWMLLFRDAVGQMAVGRGGDSSLASVLLGRSRSGPRRLWVR